ncbi:MAG: hypothetical protein AB7K64_09305 [Variibacter sp.]
MISLSSKWLKWPLLVGKAVILAAFAIILSPVALVVGIWHKIRGGADTTPHELADILRDASEDRHAAWDELECVDLRDARLEAIRQEALKVSEPLTPDDRSKLIKLAEQADALV